MDSRIYHAIHSFLFHSAYRTKKSRRHGQSNARPSPLLPHADGAHNHARRHKLRKHVHWGAVVQLPDRPRKGYYPNYFDERASNHKPILKPQTSLDRSMYYRNLWAMIELADQRLGYLYDCLRAADDEAGLDWIIKVDDEFMGREANRRARVSADKTWK
ncbi:hypothetical protein F9C07_1548311 [Aspergillus flavus]|uniref:Uncharacterized protein n=3 Tax=Aspergillus subgen. Circumdati TaxID=2720871 RepID=A0A7U2MUW5_ASPFN|nr:hypothetical protein F9C07_1548311 [Aspergillus flavus]GMF68981.1 unnamed protein product [Aspergillus oryzae]GMG43790.1 unnamed protein product [Aspergillus oryzae var. brunneus]GMF84688.1 unnamed protein product [Aspergillus oryzae]GMG03339.1 unnamed protein product [Aspergillus oryzae]